MPKLFFLGFVFLYQMLTIESDPDVLVLFDSSLRIGSALTSWLQPSDFSCSAPSIETTTTTTTGPFIVYSCTNGFFGANCTVSSDICEVSQPCENGGTCSLNTTSSLGYQCQCPSGFSGDICQFDDRVCTSDTCWNNGTCIETNNASTFTCQCRLGYDGIYCESYSDMCGNITCENHGVCQSTYLNWYCQCLDDSLYSGSYCEQTSSSLKTKKALSLSFAIVAIVAISVVGAFVVTMDVLKYVFKIDPVDRERHRLEMEKEKEKQKRFRKKQKANTSPMKLFYVHTHA